MKKWSKRPKGIVGYKQSMPVGGGAGRVGRGVPLGYGGPTRTGRRH